MPNKTKILENWYYTYISDAEALHITFLTSYRWYHAGRAYASKWDFSEEQFKVFWLLCSVLISRLYEVKWNYKVLLYMKSMLFLMVPSFSKILIHIDITVHTLFCPAPLMNSPSSDDGTMRL